MKTAKQRLHLLFTPTKITLKYSIHHILNTTLYIKHNTIKMILKVFYMFIHGFLPHQLSRPSIHATFGLAHEKQKTSQRIVRHMTKVIVRDNIHLLLK